MTNNLTKRYLTRPMSRPNMLRSTNRLTMELKTLVNSSPSDNPITKRNVCADVNALICAIQNLWDKS